MEDIIHGRACLAANFSNLRPEFGQVTQARIAQDGHHSMTRTQFQRGLHGGDAWGG